MVFSICCLALFGDASAVELSDQEIGTYGVIVDKTGTFSWPDMSWSSSTDAGVMSSGAKNFASSGSNQMQRIYTGKQIDFIGSASRTINVRHGTWTYASTGWVEGVKGVKGLFIASLAYASRGDNYSQADYTFSVVPASWTFEVTTNAKTYTRSGNGNRATIDITFDEIEQVRGMTFKFNYPSISTVKFSSWTNAHAAFLWSLSSTSIRLVSANEQAEYQDDVLSGINESNQQQAQTNGLLEMVVSGLEEIFTTITELPSKIAEAIKGLFVPTDAQMEELKGSFNNLLSEKLGFVYQAGSLVDGVFDAVFDAVDNPDSDVSFSVPAFPSFDVAGTEVSLWEDPVVVDIADNEVVQTVQQVASPFVVAVMIWGFVHSMEEAFLAFVGGKSLAEWVRNRKEDAD